jgi:hypothetical protein
MAVAIHETASQRDGVDFREQQAIVSAHSSIRHRSQKLPNHTEHGLVRLCLQAGGSVAARRSQHYPVAWYVQ